MTARSFSAPVRACNDNRAPRDVTRLSLMAFGPSLIVAIVVTSLFLARVW